eukprot:696959-Alexandrium_andersonii.AAC.1
MGRLPARARHPETGRTSHTCQDPMNRISSARADSTSPGSKTAPAMSSRYVCLLDHAPRTPEDSGSAESVSESRARKCVMSGTSASFMLE